MQQVLFQLVYSLNYYPRAVPIFKSVIMCYFKIYRKRPVSNDYGRISWLWKLIHVMHFMSTCNGCRYCGSVTSLGILSGNAQSYATCILKIVFFVTRRLLCTANLAAVWSFLTSEKASIFFVLKISTLREEDLKRWLTEAIIQLMWGQLKRG